MSPEVQAIKGDGKLPKRLLKILKKLWQDLPESEFSQYLPKDDKWKQKYKEPDTQDTAGLPKLPEGWVWSSLESISITQGGYSFRSKGCYLYR